MPKKHLENFFMIKLLKKLCIENVFQVFPGGPEIKTACKCRGHGFIPRSRKIPHASEQLTLCATTREATTTRSLCIATTE